MNEALIRQFLERPTSDSLDELALGLLQRQRAQQIVGTDGWMSDALAADSWRGFTPATAASLVGRELRPGTERMLSAAARAAWRALKPPVGTPVLLLLPDSPTESTTSLASEIVQSSSEDDVAHPVRDNRLDGLAARSWLGGRQRSDDPAWLVASGDLGTRLFEDLERRRLRFRLPPGSQMLRLCSYRELAETSHQAAVAGGLGIPSADICYLVEQPTLVSPIPIGCDHHGNLKLSQPLPWVRYRLVRRAESERQILAVLDLATTRLPAYQALDWTVSDRAGGIWIQPPA